MKCICVISHEKPLSDGRFEKYEAGEEYELDKFDDKFKLIKEEKKGGKRT